MQVILTNIVSVIMFPVINFKDLVEINLNIVYLYNKWMH